MAFPKMLRDALEANPMVHFDGDDYIETFQHTCEGARHHSPQPLLVYRTPLSPDDDLIVAWLCGTCRSNLHVLQHLIEVNDGDVPWPVRREFGNILRALAEKGHEMYVKACRADEDASIARETTGA